MANVSFMDLGILLLIGLMVTFSKGSSAISKEANQVRRLEVAQLAKLSSMHSTVQSGGSPAPPIGEDSCDTLKPRRRSKRCTCYTYKDKECVYYCHLDIIWINTPERTVPYGLSSYRGSQRVRRSAEGGSSRLRGVASQRCVCAVQVDLQCSRFCSQRRSSP